MARIKVIPHEESNGELREIYDHLVKTRGKLAAVHQIQSLNPPTIMQHMDLYMGIMFGASPLKRYQREMMAVVVSKANECDYCQVHHAEALNHYWKDDAKTAQLRSDFRKVELSDVDTAFCEMAEALTLSPGSQSNSPALDNLRSLGVDDRAILDATLVISYFNFVNRMVLNLGVELNEGEEKGYNF